MEAAFLLSGRDILYEHDSTSVQLTAIRARGEWGQSQDGMVVREAKHREWIMRRRIVDFEEAFAPTVGDRITDVEEGDVYEVMSPGGQQAWAYMGSSVEWIRVFTKRVG
jgi:hypothetical protein